MCVDDLKWSRRFPEGCTGTKGGRGEEEVVAQGRRVEGNWISTKGG